MCLKLIAAGELVFCGMAKGGLTGIYSQRGTRDTLWQVCCGTVDKYDNAHGSPNQHMIADRTFPDSSCTCHGVLFGALQRRAGARAAVNLADNGTDLHLLGKPRDSDSFVAALFSGKHSSLFVVVSLGSGKCGQLDSSPDQSTNDSSVSHKQGRVQSECFQL
jgi:hypothetical protein